MKIILSDLIIHLFPEWYPYYNRHFAECSNYLKQKDCADKCILNISFFIKLTKLSLSIENEEHRMVCYLLFEKIIDNYYDWNKEYNWQELKLLLLYFKYFSTAKSIREIKNIFSNASTLLIFEKYKPIKNCKKTLNIK